MFPNNLISAFLILTVSGVESQAEECCLEKLVGATSYTLLPDVLHSSELPGGCHNNCVYTVTGTSTPKFCFGRGDLPTECSAIHSLAEVLSSSPSNKDETVPEGKDPLVPTKLRQAPNTTAQVFWPSSRTIASPGAAIDAINMVDRPKMTWNADPESYYFIIAVDEGIPRIQTPGLVYIHWLVTNVPGDKVYAGDEVDQYVPPFSYKFNEAGDGVVEDGTPLHAILFLVYKQPGRIDFEGGQWGCEPNLGMRVVNKEELAEKYGLGEPVAANMIYTKYSPAGTDYLFCMFTRCGANPRGGPFPIPLPGINDGPECQPSTTTTTTAT